MSRAITTVGSRRGEGGVLVGFDVEVVNAKEVERALTSMTGAEAKKALDDATRKASLILRYEVKKAAPPGATGKLKKSVSSRKAKGGIGRIVSPRPKVAFYRHMVIKGTKAHRIRFANQKARGINKRFGNIEHPGIKHGNAFVQRGFDAGKARAEAKMKAELARFIEEKTSVV